MDNLTIGYFLISLPAILYLIEKLTSKRDGRFNIGYRPNTMSVKGWVFSILWFAIWLFIAFKIAK